MEIVATYRKHGWELKRALLQFVTRAEISAKEADILAPITIKEDVIDALWFGRPSNNNRTAWELRLLSETQYALFETFEADETEEQREEKRQAAADERRDHKNYTLPILTGISIFSNLSFSPRITTTLTVV